MLPKIMKQFIFNLLALLLCSQAHSHTLFISDIDDTLKASQSNNKLVAALLSANTQSSIAGMSELYQHIEHSVNNIEFVYISAAPYILLNDLHAEFLTEHNFPSGQLILRARFENSFDFKVREITNIIKNRKNITKLIMIGDNGQADARVFKKISKKFPSISSSSFIRQTYHKTSNPNFNTAYVSPIEICIGLERDQNITCPRSFIKNIHKKILNERDTSNIGSYFFHPYMDCRKYTWPFKEINSPFLNDIGETLNYKCS